MGYDADRNPHYHRMKDVAMMMIKNSDGGFGRAEIIAYGGRGHACSTSASCNDALNLALILERFSSDSFRRSRDLAQVSVCLRGAMSEILCTIL